jgi:tetratricopeptide (TPR) repeat protein
LTDFAAKHPDRRMGVAIALEDVGATAEAEKLLRDEARGTQPEAVLVLAEFLGRHRHLSEALSLCAEAFKTCPPKVVAASSLAAIRAGGAGEPEMAALADRLAAESAKHPDSVELLQARAELAEQRGRFDEALSLYQDALRLNPNFVPALNNRAWLLALKETPGGEAMDLIDRVLKQTGPIANYLDTRAVAYLAGRQPSPAVADLEEAIRQDPSAAFYFHLADARLRAGDRAAAVAALQEGKKRGLRAEVVHPLEQERYRQTLAELDKE